MSEKSKLMELFRKVMEAAEEASTDSLEVQKNPRLSRKGKEEDREEIRRQFVEAVNMYRDEMLKLVDDREAKYMKDHTSVIVDRFRRFNYVTDIKANLEALEHGYMSRIEIVALIDLYRVDDFAMNMLLDVLQKIKSPYVNLMPARVTAEMQLNAFESIRGIIRAKVNANLMDVPVRYAGKASSGFKEGDADPGAVYAYFGSGYHAIEKELTEDLLLVHANTTLGRVNNSDKARQVHAATNAFDTNVIADKNRANAKASDTANKPDRNKLGSAGTLPV
jgi:hypothetical protein